MMGGSPADATVSRSRPGVVIHEPKRENHGKGIVFLLFPFRRALPRAVPCRRPVAVRGGSKGRGADNTHCGSTRSTRSPWRAMSSGMRPTAARERRRGFVGSW